MADEKSTAPPTRTLIRLQAASGLALTIFVGLHLFNLAVANLGPDAYDGLQGLLRALYQNPVFELVGIGVALIVHAVAGLLRARERRRRVVDLPGPRRRAPLAVRLHRWSAYYLVMVVFLHAAATRLPSLLLGVWPEFAGVSFALWWLPLLFYPYYFVLAVAGIYHSLRGVGIAARALGLRAPILGDRTILIATGCAAFVVAGALASFGGITHSIPDPADNDYARIYARYFGVELPSPPRPP